MTNHSHAISFAQRALGILALIMFSSPVSAQTGLQGWLKKMGATLDSMAISGIDHNYIEVPEQPWKILMRGNISQTTVSMKTEGVFLNEKYATDTRMVPKPSQEIGFWAGYRGIGMEYTMNVGGDKGSHLAFSVAERAYAINVRMRSFESRNPDIDIDSRLVTEADKAEMEKLRLMDPIHVNTTFADGYYFFNNRRFSYAAAYDQSVIQKRSVGAPMVGAMYHYTHINYAAASNGSMIHLMHGVGRVKQWQGSVGAGYAYNWVPARGLLVSVMAMPMLTFVNKLKAYNFDTTIPEMMDEPMFWNADIPSDEWDKWYYENIHIAPSGHQTHNSGVSIGFDGRVSVAYNFGRYFLNVNGQFNDIRYHHNETKGYLNDWFVNGSIGIRL